MLERDYSLLTQILSKEEKNLLSYLNTILSKYYLPKNIISTEQYIYATGSIPVTLIAHVDTVQTMYPKAIYRDKESQIVWSPQGLGADDRAGVFSIIKILMDGYLPSVIFTTGEETGGDGARVLANHIPFPLVDTNFLVELDRQGVSEAVFYDCNNQDFQNFICNNFNLVSRQGTFSDIMIIGPAWDIASVNLSIGYRNEHSLGEYLSCRDMFGMIETVKNILKNHGNEKYTYNKESYFVTKTCDYCGSLYFTTSDNMNNYFSACPTCMDRYWRHHGRNI